RVRARPGHLVGSPDRSRGGDVGRVAEGGAAAPAGTVAGVRQRPPQPAGGGGPGQSAEGRRRCRDVAPAAQGRPLLLRLTPGAGEGALHAVGHARRAGGDGAGPGRLRLIRRAGSEVEESAAVAEQAAVEEPPAAVTATAVAAEEAAVEEPPAVAAIAAVATHEAAVEEAVAAVTAAHVGAALADPGREI